MRGEERRFDSLGIIIARTSIMTGNARQAVDFGVGAIKKGKEIGIFLISDGVWNALSDSGKVSETLKELVANGASLYISEEHARAAGLPRNRVIEGAVFIEDTYKTLVEKVMETWKEEGVKASDRKGTRTHQSKSTSTDKLKESEDAPLR